MRHKQQEGGIPYTPQQQGQEKQQDVSEIKKQQYNELKNEYPIIDIITMRLGKNDLKEDVGIYFVNSKNKKLTKFQQIKNRSINFPRQYFGK